MSDSSVIAIYLHRTGSEPMLAVDSVTAKARGGLDGDRYFQESTSVEEGHDPDREVTLIESEAVEAAVQESGVPLTVAESRRNLVTSGVRLNPLVGREFLVGDVKLRGQRLCHPCAHLQSITRPGVLKALVNRGGLRAQVIEGGTIRVGDRLTIPADLT